MSPEAALDRLLAGTGLVQRRAAGGVVTLEVQTAGQHSGNLLTLSPVPVTGERVSRRLPDTASSVTVIDREAPDTRAGMGSTHEGPARAHHSASRRPTNPRHDTPMNHPSG